MLTSTKTIAMNEDILLHWTERGIFVFVALNEPKIWNVKAVYLHWFGQAVFLASTACYAGYLLIGRAVVWLDFYFCSAIWLVTYIHTYDTLFWNASLINIRGGPLEKWWGGGGVVHFQRARIFFQNFLLCSLFFFLNNPLLEFFFFLPKSVGVFSD